MSWSGTRPLETRHPRLDPKPWTGTRSPSRRRPPTPPPPRQLTPPRRCTRRANLGPDTPRTRTSAAEDEDDPGGRGPGRRWVPTQHRGPLPLHRGGSRRLHSEPQNLYTRDLRGPLLRRTGKTKGRRPAGSHPPSETEAQVRRNKGTTHSSRDRNASAVTQTR